MSDGTTVFQEWLDKVQPRVNYIRDAYLAYGVLEELMNDAEDIVADWQVKSTADNENLAKEANDRLEAARQVHQSYETAYTQVGIQMDIVRAELNNLHDERLKIGAMCQSLNVQNLGIEVLQRAYDAIGPDTAIDSALNTAKQAVNELDAEARARQELNNFLANS